MTEKEAQQSTMPVLFNDLPPKLQEQIRFWVGMVVKDAEAAMKERCAKLAEWQDPLLGPPRREAVAAAIRALE